MDLDLSCGSDVLAAFQLEDGKVLDSFAGGVIRLEPPEIHLLLRNKAKETFYQGDTQ